ncbi:MAG: type II toxin-antitoxin system HicA family toxin [Prochlorococcus sp.]
MIKQLDQAGCILLRHGGRHDIYSQPITGRTQPVPRHHEINEILAIVRPGLMGALPENVAGESLQSRIQAHQCQLNQLGLGS